MYKLYILAEEDGLKQFKLNCLLKFDLYVWKFSRTPKTLSTINSGNFGVSVTEANKIAF